MPGFMPGIHVLHRASKARLAGTSPAMTPISGATPSSRLLLRPLAQRVAAEGHVRIDFVHLHRQADAVRWIDVGEAAVGGGEQRLAERLARLRGPAAPQPRGDVDEAVGGISVGHAEMLAPHRARAD